MGKLAAGTAAIGKLAANSGVDIGDTDVTSVVPGTAATSLGKAEDAAAGSGDTGVAMLAVRTDTEAVSSGTTGDYEPLHTDELGALRTSTAIVDSAGDRLGLLPPVVVSAATTDLDTSALGDGDVMTDTVLTFSNVNAATGLTGHIYKITVTDIDDVGAAFDLMLFNATISEAAKNAAHDLSDADAQKIEEVVSFAAGDYVDHGATGNKTATLRFSPPIPFEATGRDLIGLLVSRGTPTYISTAGLKFKMHVQKD